MNLTLKCMTAILLMCFNTLAEVQDDSSNTLKIAFGACGHQDRPLLIFNEVVKQNPDLFIFLGDNIYGDTKDMNVLRAKYQSLGNKPSYQNLKKQCEILAIWDDHDYGENDGGKNYSKKEESKQVFLDFFEEPKNSERYQHAGIYHTVYKKVGEKTLQIILLDVRTFRDDLNKQKSQQNNPKKYFYHLDYKPHTDSSKTLLGKEQWAWLEQELRKPADCRIIATGTQLGIEYNGYEAWANFPNEQERFVQLIHETQANHVVFISGDVHYAEISKFKHKDCYPLYDITSSGLSQSWRFATPNQNRIEGPIMDNHFGLMTIFLEEPTPRILAEIWDIHGNQRVDYVIPLDEIRFFKK